MRTHVCMRAIVLCCHVELLTQALIKMIEHKKLFQLKKKIFVEWLTFLFWTKTINFDHT